MYHKFICQLYLSKARGEEKLQEDNEYQKLNAQNSLLMIGGAACKTSLLFLGLDLDLPSCCVASCPA